MIRLRFVALLSAFGLLLAGYLAYEAYFQHAPHFVGATDAAHVTAAKGMIAGLPTPTGMTADPYGTSCDTAGTACYASGALEPEAAFAAMNAELVSQGGRLRSHACGGKNLMEHGCVAVVDYRGSAITVTAAPAHLGDARAFLRLSVSGADDPQRRKASAPYGTWASVDPLPAAWTLGITCKTSAATGCSRFQQLSADSPVIAATLTEGCATARRVMMGHYYIVNELSSPATPTTPASCGFLGHRYRTVGGKDGELLSISVRTAGAGHVTVGVILSADS